MKKRCMYLVCDFNGRWLKDLHLLGCIIILMNEERIIVDNLQVGCLFKLVIMYFL
jgi:hypothetical protein